MSGGAYDYVFRYVDEAADQLYQRHQTPVVLAFVQHLRDVARVLHDIEWADSGDTEWDSALDDEIRGVVPNHVPLEVAVQLAQTAREALSDEIRRAGA